MRALATAISLLLPSVLGTTQGTGISIPAVNPRDAASGRDVDGGVIGERIEEVPGLEYVAELTVMAEAAKIDAVFFGDIANDGNRISSARCDFGYDLFQRTASSRSQHDARALFRKQQRGCAADA